MKINPIQSWKQMDKKQKVATVAKTAAGAAAIATVVTAGVMGKKAVAGTEINLKSLKGVGKMFAEGFKAMGSSIAGKANKVKDTVVNFLANLKPAKAAEASTEELEKMVAQMYNT